MATMIPDLIRSEERESVSIIKYRHYHKDVEYFATKTPELESYFDDLASRFNVTDLNRCFLDQIKMFSTDRKIVLQTVLKFIKNKTTNAQDTDKILALYIDEKKYLYLASTVTTEHRAEYRDVWEHQKFYRWYLINRCQSLTLEYTSDHIVPVYKIIGMFGISVVLDQELNVNYIGDFQNINDSKNKTTAQRRILFNSRRENNHKQLTIAGNEFTLEIINA